MKESVRILLCVGYFIAFGLALLHGIVTAIRWWRGEPVMAWEYGLLTTLPILVFVFVTRYSIFRRDCDRCALEPGKKDT